MISRAVMVVLERLEGSLAPRYNRSVTRLRMLGGVNARREADQTTTDLIAMGVQTTIMCREYRYLTDVELATASSSWATSQVRRKFTFTR